MKHNAGREKHIEHLSCHAARNGMKECAQCSDLLGRHRCPGERDNGARPFFCRRARKVSEHIRKRHDGELADNGRNDETVEKKSDSADAQPPKSRRTDLLSECAHAERGRAADDRTHKREGAEQRAGRSAGRQKRVEFTFAGPASDAEPKERREVGQNKQSEIVHRKALRRIRKFMILRACRSRFRVYA